MQYAFMIAGLVGFLLSARCSAKTLILISLITFLTSTLIAYASGHSVGDSIDAAIALICTLQTSYYVSRIDVEIAQGMALPNRETFAELERLLGIYVGDLGAVQPGSPEESMHMELGTLPDPGRFETKRGAGQQPVRKQSRAA